MPHAENGSQQSNMVNGEKHSSEFLNHLQSYPLVSTSIDTFKSYPIGSKSLHLANQGYATFLAPILQTVFSIPLYHNYVHPYVNYADNLASSTLDTIDTHFPLVKDEPQKIKETLFEYAHTPLKVAGETKEYVFKTYENEYKKCGGDGYVSGGKAVVTTGLVVASETLGKLSGYLGSKKEEAKGVVREKTGN